MYLVKTSSNGQQELYLINAETGGEAIEKFNCSMDERFIKYDDIEAIELTCKDDEIKQVDFYGDISFYSIPVAWGNK